MSTPAGKPVNPIDPFAYASRDTRKRGGPERHPSEDDNNPLRSPSAPTRAHERAGTERHPLENDHDPLRSPYAPKKARTQPDVEPDFATSEDAAPLAPLDAPKGFREHPQRHAVDVDESDLFSYHAPGGARGPGGSLSKERDDHSPKTAPEEVIAREHPVDLDAAPSLQPAHPNSQQREQPAAERHAEIIRDLERLEASLRWVQREEAAARLPRATQLPPVPGLPPVDARGRRHSDEMFVDDVRLEPERLVPPPSLRDHLRWPLRILIASIFAAPIGYYFSVGGWAPPSARGPQIASLDPIVVAPPPMSEVESETVAMLQPGETGTQASPSNRAIRALDPEDIKLLTKQGEQFAAAGDLVTARLLFQRAAEAGDATAAMLLGATYDPIVLAKLGVVGIGADVEKARSWYQKAANLGSPDAKRRLELLANR